MPRLAVRHPQGGEVRNGRTLAAGAGRGGLGIRHGRVMSSAARTATAQEISSGTTRSSSGRT